MTDRLREIRERFDAIIPGPWRWYGNTAADQVFLATIHGGRMFILYPDAYTSEYVFDHNAVESCTLDQARQRMTEWCFSHGSAVDPIDPGECICDRLREFLDGELSEEEGRREFDAADRGYVCGLTRGRRVHTDLRLADHASGVIRSYRESAKYEVLGHCTREEFERRQRQLDKEGPRDFRPTANEALYREDFCGIDNPEAEFIARAPEDIGWLLNRVAALEAAAEAAWDAMVHRPVDSELFIDAIEQVRRVIAPPEEEP